MRTLKDELKKWKKEFNQNFKKTTHVVTGKDLFPRKNFKEVTAKDSVDAVKNYTKIN